MEIAVIILWVLNVVIAVQQHIIKMQTRMLISKWQQDQLKYQKHLRNSFDYLGLMQKAMSDGDVLMFKQCSELVAEELNKCNEIIK